MYDLTSLGLFRRKRVLWMFEGDHTNTISSLRSKSLQKFLPKAEELLREQGITWELKPITAQEYAHWLPYYEENMRLHTHDILAKPDWYAQKIAEGKQVLGLFFKKNDSLVGSGIMVQTANEYISLAYKANDFISLSSQSNSSLGSVIDYFYLRYACENGISRITGGRSYNAFGVETTLGYLEFKTNFYSPVLEETEAVVQTVPLPENFVKPVVFYGEELTQPLQPHLCVVSRTPLTEDQLKQYRIPTIPYRVITI
jgi:hypothetical protein